MRQGFKPLSDCGTVELSNKRENSPKREVSKPYKILN
jgi:hypothetical protein